MSNLFVRYLNRYTTVSSEHEAAFDEFITQVPPPSGEPLCLDTKTEQFLKERFNNPNPSSIILTGNAGDGKTYLCRQIIEEFTGQAVADWQTTDWPVPHHGLTLRVVKDLSEMDETSGAKVLTELARELNIEHSKTIFLIAANEGRLRAVLRSADLTELYQAVDHQLKSGPDLGNEQLTVLNLNQVSTSTYVPQVLEWLTHPAHWHACNGCPAFNTCPIRFNATRLATTPTGERLTKLYQILEHLAQHVTIRDMLIHLAYTLTGGLNCEHIIHQSRELWWEPYHYVYYENAWGQQTDETLRRKIAVIHNLRHLNVGEDSLFELDDFIVNGAPNDETKQAEHDTLFAPALDLGVRLFEQHRSAYLRGGASSPDPDQTHALIDWLPHIRRKLFFEWQNIDQAYHLFPFRFLPDYFELLDGEQSRLTYYRDELILGLNRAFSGLFINDKRQLYVTSQYTGNSETPVPIVRVQIPVNNIKLQVKKPDSIAFDQAQAGLHLEFAPPGFVKAELVSWSLDLLRFEYLLRRARGGTPNILAPECELSIRQLKDILLAKFVADDEDEREITFFAADRYSYTLRTIWVDENTNRIQTRG